jgi:cytochrome c oxidase subunit 2
LAQVITYTRNAFGNKVGDEVQPKEIQEMLSKASGAATATEPEAKAAPKEKVDANVVLSKDELVAKGKEVYASNCASCHQAEGQGMPPTFPALTGSAVVKGDINAKVNLMLHGKGMMPAFGALDATDFAAVVTYTRNGLGNSVNDVIQPAAIQTLQSALPAAKDD